MPQRVGSVVTTTHDPATCWCGGKVQRCVMFEGNWQWMFALLLAVLAARRSSSCQFALRIPTVEADGKSAPVFARVEYEKFAIFLIPGSDSWQATEVGSLVGR